LGRANYADQTGEYYTAFCGLSIGLERLAKLILVADHAISNSGEMPAEKIVRKYGHKLADLIKAADEIGIKHSLKLDYSRPTTAISEKIIECLDAFADAGRGRYANLAALGDPNLGQEEPIRKWWSDIAELILKEHYYGKAIQKRVEGRARVVDDLMSSISHVLYINENGDAMRDVLTSSIRTGQTQIVQQSADTIRLRSFAGFPVSSQSFRGQHVTHTTLMRFSVCGNISKAIPWMIAF
jgi:hypothetical protein